LVDTPFRNHRDFEEHRFYTQTVLINIAMNLCKRCYIQEVFDSYILHLVLGDRPYIHLVRVHRYYFQEYKAYYNQVQAYS
jgi:hypothetical protein